MMKTTPKSLRLHVGLFGRRNVGKSSLLNALTRQMVSIVSEVAGTTTDPVEKPMEFLPLGPVLFIDTAGIDDSGALGTLRVKKTLQVFDRTDLGIIVSPAEEWGAFEEALLKELHSRHIPTIVVFNKVDCVQPEATIIENLSQRKIPLVKTVATTGAGIYELREALIRSAPQEFINAASLIGDLVSPGELVMLVVPIDLEAPRGRLIQAQVQCIRDILDHNAYCMIVKERELRDALSRLTHEPALVVTDSQAFHQVHSATPAHIPLTSFSIAFARYKGDLNEFVRGALAVDSLRPGSRVLVAEACSHHPIGEDIGRVKIPRWLNQYVGGSLEFTTVQGHDFPDDLESYQLVVHCGACMWNRREMLSRMLRCKQSRVPITNYGVAIAYSLGILERALVPFPLALQTYLQLRSAGQGKH